MIHLKKNQSGVTLIEVVVVIALLGILAGFAYPNFKSWIPNYKLKAAARDLVSNFQRAKMEAVKRNKWVEKLENVKEYLRWRKILRGK